MTQPPIDPRPEPAADSPTEAFVPPPPFGPSAAPQTMPAGAPPAFTPPGSSASAGAPPAFVPPPMPFAPTEPGPGDAFSVPPARALRPETRGSSGTVLNIALGAAILVGAVGIAFAVGRATSPGSGANPIANQGDDGRGLGAPNAGGGVPADPNANGGANGNGNNGSGNGGNGGNGGTLPNPSIDLNGNGGGRGGFGQDGDNDNGAGVDRGFGRGFGLGGAAISGTVTEVASDHVTVKLANGLTVTFGLDGTTTYHQQTAASQSDVKTGSTVQVQLGTNGRIQPQQDANGNFTLGTAGDITVVP
jgi:hypothetical protein